MFNEENTVEQMVLDTLCGGVTSNMVAEDRICFSWESM
jgi:type I restriction enzyme R subunit